VVRPGGWRAKKWRVIDAESWGSGRSGSQDSEAAQQCVGLSDSGINASLICDTVRVVRVSYLQY